MTIESMIPTFVVGERVILHWGDVESSCPLCSTGAILAKREFLGTTEIVTILNEGTGTGFGHCHKCDGTYKREKGSGWWVVETDNGDAGIVPYTLLEKIDG